MELHIQTLWHMHMYDCVKLPYFTLFVVAFVVAISKVVELKFHWAFVCLHSYSVQTAQKVVAKLLQSNTSNIQNGLVVAHMHELSITWLQLPQFKPNKKRHKLKFYFSWSSPAAIWGQTNLEAIMGRGCRLDANNQIRYIWRTGLFIRI